MTIYISNTPKYCTYLTIYFGNKMPMFYIGSSSIEKIKNGYHGTVGSKKYKSIWDQELKNNFHLFKTIILEKFYSRKNAYFNEKLLQMKFNVVSSDLFINMSIVRKNGYYGFIPPMKGKKHSEETKLKMKNSKRIKKRSLETRKKMSTIKLGKIRPNEIKEKISCSLAGNMNRSIKVEINGICYKSKKEAMEILNITQNKLKLLLDNSSSE